MLRAEAFVHLFIYPRLNYRCPPRCASLPVAKFSRGSKYGQPTAWGILMIAHRKVGRHRSVMTSSKFKFMRRSTGPTVLLLNLCSFLLLLNSAVAVVTVQTTPPMEQEEERELHACMPGCFFKLPARLISCRPNANAGNLARSPLLSWPVAIECRSAHETTWFSPPLNCQ